MQYYLSTDRAVMYRFVRSELFIKFVSISQGRLRCILTDESSVGLETHGSTLPETAGGRKRRRLTVLLEISQSRPERADKFKYGHVMIRTGVRHILTDECDWIQILPDFFC